MTVVYTAFVGFNGPNSSHYGNRALLLDLLACSNLDGYTVTYADGVYEGQAEPSAVVTVIGNTDEQAMDYGEAIIEVCRQYKEQAGQAEVWITRRTEDLYVV